MDTRFTTRFTAQARVYTPSEDVKGEAHASLDQLKGLLPADVVPENDMDLLYIVGNLAVGGVMNLNDDGVTCEDMLGCYTRFERRQCNIEHNRKQIVGYILKAGLSELGTDRLITPDEARASGKPFNLTTVAVIWKVADKDLCDYLVQAAAPGSPDSGALSLSFEVGFNDYDVGVLPKDSTNLSQASRVITPRDPDFDRFNAMLRVNKGSGRVGKTGERIGRILSPPLIPLGQGVVTIPAAAVKGIEPILTSPHEAEAPDQYADLATTLSSQSISDLVYITLPSLTPTMSTSTAVRVKLPAGLIDKAKGLNYPKADITLSDGRTLKGVTVFNGYELELDKELADGLQGVVITNMTPQEAPQIDDSPTIHPNIDQIYPTRDPEGSKKADDDEARKQLLRNMPYTDAILKHLESAARLLRIIADDSGVSTSQITSNTHTPLSSMKLDDLKQLEAKVKNATKPEELTEALASMSLMAQEIMKASEEYSKAADKAAEDKKKATDEAEAVKKDIAEAKKVLKEMQDAQAAALAESKFQDRMSAVAAAIQLDDEARAYVVEDVRACADDAAFERYLTKAKKLMKGTAKASDNCKSADDDHGDSGKGAATLPGKDTVDSQDDKSDGLGIKHGTKDDITSTEAAKKDKKADKKSKDSKNDSADDGKDDDEDDACMSSAKAAISSAQANPTDKGSFDVIGDTATVSVLDKYKKAFASGVSIGGRKVADFTKASKATVTQ